MLKQVQGEDCKQQPVAKMCESCIGRSSYALLRLSSSHCCELRTANPKNATSVQHLPIKNPKASPAVVSVCKAAASTEPGRTSCVPDGMVQALLHGGHGIRAEEVACALLFCITMIASLHMYASPYDASSSSPSSDVHMHHVELHVYDAMDAVDMQNVGGHVTVCGDMNA